MTIETVRFSPQLSPQLSSQQLSPQISVLSRAIKASLMTIALAGGVAAPVYANDTINNDKHSSAKHNTAKAQQYQVAAGVLSYNLSRIASDAGIALSFDPSLTKGLNNKAISGHFTALALIERLLIGSGLKLIKRSDASYTITADTNKIGTLATAVIASEDLKDGSAEDGYRTDKITAVGPWQGRTLQETPYSINVTSESLIQNLQATNADQIFMMNPLTQLNRPTMMQGMATVFMRGFEQGNLARNGVLPQGYVAGQGLVMEEVAQVEVLTGLNGFIYGASGVGGIINYVTKKPTAERFNTITFGNTSDSNVYLHGDFGGQFDDEGTFGYRINLVTQDGETHINQQNIKRDSISVAFDWQITDNLIVKINGNKRDHKVLGEQPNWIMANDVSRPDADSIDNSSLWNQPWIESNWDSERLGASLNWQPTNDIALRAAYLDEEISNYGVYSYDNKIQADGSIKQGYYSSLEAPTVTKGAAGYIFADFHLITGSINHKITAGWQFGESSWHDVAEGWSQDQYFTSALSKPVYFPEPKWDAHRGPHEKLYTYDNQSFILGDDIQFNQQWSALIGINYTDMTYINIPGIASNGDFDQNFITPTISLIYKATEAITTYASYIEGVGESLMADEWYIDDSGERKAVINANVMLEPIVSKQIELGIKANVGDMLLTAAIFTIDKALEQYQQVDNGLYKFTQDGRQVHQGLEFTATGKLTDNLTLMGGFTLLDAKIKDLVDKPELEGNTPINVAENMVKLYAEYNVDTIPNLVINGGFSYNGSFYGGGSTSDHSNSEKLPAYTIVNMGARYALTLVDKEVTFRLNVNNLTDERYWVSHRFLGTSRTVSLSASVEF